MSPEQCSGLALTPASDVYSLGIILYEMLTAVTPFSADTPLAMAMKQVTEAPVPPRELVPSIPRELEMVISHALTKNPADRPPNANEFRRELHATAESLGLEHAESLTTPTMEALREAGTESPSGRLLIDLATLRQVQAATSGDTTTLSRPRSTSGDTAVLTDSIRPEFARVNVPVEKKGLVSHRARVAAIAMTALVAVIISIAVATSWRYGSDSTNANQSANANAASPTPTASPLPSPSPKPDREVKNQPKKEKKIESKFGSFVRKVRRIFKK